MKIGSLFTLITLLFFASCAKDEVTNITLSEINKTLNVGETDTLVAEVSSKGDVNERIEWTTSNANVVTVSDGVITAIAKGNAIITAQVGDKTATCEITVVQGFQNIHFDNASASFWGDFYETNTNDLDLFLFENSLKIDDAGNITGTGSYLYIDFSVALGDSTLKEGTYSVDTTGVAFTFYPGEIITSESGNSIAKSHLLTIRTDADVAYLIKDGFYIITKSGDNYLISGELVSENNELIHFSYEGPINITDKTASIAPVLTKGDLWYWGVAYTGAASNNFTVYLGSDDINMDSLTGDGEILVLELNTPLTVTNNLPDGTYEMIAELTLANLVPNTLVFGYETTEGNQWGCWYYGTTTKALIKGKAIVTKSGTQYMIAYTLYDESGTKVTGTYNGILRYTDGTVNQSVSAIRLKKSKAANRLSKKMRALQKKRTIRFHK